MPRNTHSNVVRRQGEHRQVLVAGLGHVVDDRGREAVGEAEVRRPVRVQRGEDVGVVVAQQVAHACQERMAVTDLRRTPPIGLERLARIRRELERVALEQRDLMPITGERDACRQPRDACSDDRHTCHGSGNVAGPRSPARIGRLGAAPQDGVSSPNRR